MFVDFGYISFLDHILLALVAGFLCTKFEDPIFYSGGLRTSTNITFTCAKAFFQEFRWLLRYNCFENGILLVVNIFML